ncbi:alpha/beta hydrolase [Chelatococcus sp. GCM10030263]|uniref:alpha/beta hydrolase n=1 Tax=Chelatococcus sp. GCM10030263 TaxID=3273387 RepID=UPI00360944B7
MESSDGFGLSGVLFEPEGRRAPSLVIWFHGIHLQFCEPEYAAIGRAVAARGTAFLSVNTRGRDFGVWMRGRSGLKLAGSGWELLQECTADIEGWLRFAKAEGYDRLILAGHGFGGSKIVYHLSEHHEPAVRGVILASCASIIRDTLRPELSARAKAMVAEGRGMDLLPWGTRPGIMTSTVSAQVHVARERLRHDLYGDGQQPPALTRIRVPVLAWFGEQEVTPERDANRFLESTAQNLTASPMVNIKLLPGASYLYTGAEAVVAREILRWVGRISRT